jgi:transcriptional regulator GlxA family with amidase domain
MALEGCMLSSIASASDCLRVAQTLAAIRAPNSGLKMETVLFGARGQERIMTSTGIEIGGLVAPPEDIDLLLLPGIMHNSAHDLGERVQAMGPELELIRRYHLRGIEVAGTCSGSYLLAESGLLDGHRATCSWWLAASFRERYPRVQLEADAMVVEDGGMTTAGGACSVQSLLMKLIARTGGEELALQTSRMLLIDIERQSQAPYVSDALMAKATQLDVEKGRALPQPRTASRDQRDRAGRALRHLRSAACCATSAATWACRRSRTSSTCAWNAPRRCWRTTHLSFDEIVERCGYNDSASFRKAVQARHRDHAGRLSRTLSPAPALTRVPNSQSQTG